VSRPPCVARIDQVRGEKRPRFLPGEGVGSIVRRLGDATGLTRMGVSVREIEPGMAGTHRHYHMVEEEWVYVLEGRGTVRIGPHHLPVRPGSFAGFPPGPTPHHLVADWGERLVILEGGERRPAEDFGFYVDLARGWTPGPKLVDAPGPLPPEQGDASQCVHPDDLAPRDHQHDVDAEARRAMKRLERPTGLVRQAVVWSRVEPGAHSTALHTHARTDEWVLVLQGRARARVGDQRFEVGPGDFLGHPAGGPAHVMEPIERLTYLMGGERDADDIVIYPEAGVRRVRGKLEPLGA
jgi:uncharacterized cupin superfamily protein